MSNDILQQMEDHLPEMTVAQRKVAEFISQDAMEAAFSTIEKIASSAGVSTTSVIRLANTLGYGSFSEFQKDLKDYLRIHSSPINKLSLNCVDAIPDALQTDVISCVYRNELENIASAMQMLNRNTLEEIAQKLEQAKNIYICGARTSESVARYLTYNLNRMFLNVTYVSDSLSGELTALKKIDPADVLIAVTVSRYNKGICKIASLCKRWNIPVVAITDSFDSPLIPCSDFQLVGKCRSNAFHNSIISQIFLCDLLIKICSQANPARVRENLKRDEMIVEEMDYFIRK